MGKAIKSLLLTLICIWAFIGSAFAEEFSADVINASKGQKFNGKIFVANDKIRMEIPGAVTITRIDKNIVWILMPQQNAYMEQPIDRKTVVAATGRVPDVVSRKFIEDEIVNGRNTKKYHVVYRTLGNETEIYQWLDNSMGVPVKTAAVDGSWSVEYRNIKTGNLDQSVFEIPAGYNKFAIPNMNNLSEYRETESAGD